ncbi:hypothetical protein OH77DRAFT_1524669 [Trametes cingulata]|nr:hypothetical protein OH77DRAFT_1524669 [Trametes cingulata]
MSAVTSATNPFTSDPLLMSTEPISGMMQSSDAPSQFRPEVDSNGWYTDKPRIKTDFPNVPYWHRKDWIGAEKQSTVPGQEKGKKGPSRMADNENVNFGFITDAEGNPIDGHRAQTIRRRFREFCIHLHQEGRAPETWQRGIDAQITVEYHHWMRTQCYELQLCEDNWKADKVAGLSNYSQWKKKFECKLARRAMKEKAAKKKDKKQKKKQKDSEGASIQEPGAHGKDDEDFEQDLAGARRVHDVLGQAPYRLSPDAEGLDEHVRVDCIAGPSSRRRQQANQPEDAPTAKRARTASPAPLSRPSSPTLVPEMVIESIDPSPPSPQGSDENPVSTQAPASQSELPRTIPALSEAPAVQELTKGKQKMSFPDPLLGLNWGESDSELPSVDPKDALETRTTSACTESEPGPSATAGSGQHLPQSVIGATSLNGPTAIVKPSRPKVPKPRKVTNVMAVWPPPDDEAHGKLKDICARIWAGKNSNGTREAFDLWYRNMKPHRRTAYAATGGGKGDTATMAASC